MMSKKKGAAGRSAMMDERPEDAGDQVMQEIEMSAMQRHFAEEQKSTGERILHDMQTKQKNSFITDLFALLAEVLRDRTGHAMQDGGDSDWDDIIRGKDAQIFTFSMIGVLSTVVIALLFWYSYANATFDDETGKLLERANLSMEQAKPTRLAALYFFQVVTTISSIVTCILIVQKYLLYLDEKRRMWSGIDTYTYVQSYAGKDEDEDPGDAAEKTLATYSNAYSLWRSGLRWKCLAEICVQLIHPVIWMNEARYVDPVTGAKGFDWQTLYEAMTVLVCLRFYLLVNILYSFSREYKQRHKILASNPELQRSGFQITVNGTMQAMFFRYPVLFSGFLLVISLASLGFVVFILERREQPEVSTFGTLQNSFWFTFVTFSTVGYGDMSPTSPLGRLAAILIGAIGISVTTIVGGVATNLMVQSREQRYVSEYLNLVEAADATKESAARVIQAAWRYFLINHGRIQDPWLIKGHKCNFVYANIKEFRSYRWTLSQSKSSANDPVIDSKMNRLSVSLLDTVRLLEKHEKLTTATSQNIDSYVRDIARLLEHGREKSVS